VTKHVETALEQVMAGINESSAMMPHLASLAEVAAVTRPCQQAPDSTGEPRLIMTDRLCVFSGFTCCKESGPRTGKVCRLVPSP
jgi:hypothetical protein